MPSEGEMQRARVIELFSERLAFARASVELFDLAVALLESRGGPYDSVRGHLRRLREEKKAQCEWLEDHLRERGADIRQPLGVAVVPDADPGRLFESLMLAEVYDAGGWEALLAFADQSADEELAAEIRQMLREEENHLLFVSRIVARLGRTGSVEAAPA